MTISLENVLASDIFFSWTNGYLTEALTEGRLAKYASEVRVRPEYAIDLNEKDEGVATFILQAHYFDANLEAEVIIARSKEFPANTDPFGTDVSVALDLLAKDTAGILRYHRLFEIANH